MLATRCCVFVMAALAFRFFSCTVIRTRMRPGTGSQIVIATGLVNGWLLLRDTGIDLTSPYQKLLLAKVLIVGVMIAIAIVNRYVFMPTIPNGGSGLNRLRMGTIAEIVLSGGVIGLVSLLGTLSPY